MARACPQPGCPNVQPCPTHARKPWAHAVEDRHARGYDAEYMRNRAIVLREEQDCALCGGPGLSNDTADHIVPRADGGGSERSNLRRAHKRCNEARGRALAKSSAIQNTGPRGNKDFWAYGMGTGRVS
jgi:5-methylcytosine-specific restriction endonuclease McrA